MFIIPTILLLTLSFANPCIKTAEAGEDADKPTTLVHPPWSHTMGLNRVKQSHLDLYSGYRKKFASPQGVAAAKLIVNDKESPGDDDELSIYGINAGTGEIIYNKSMLSLGFYGKLGEGDGEFLDPVGIAADEKGNVFVADRGNHRIVHLVNAENELMFEKYLDFNATQKALRSPSDVALEQDRLFVADSGNDRILVSDLSGSVMDVFGGPGTLYEPFALGVLSSPDANFYGMQFLVVTDSIHQRISKFSLHGRIQRTRRFNEISPGEGGFYFAAIDYYGNVYVTDSVSGCIYKFDRYLNYLTRFGCGDGEGDRLIEPRGIAINRRFGQVFVVEKAGASYYWVGTDVLNLRGTAGTQGSMTTVQVRFLLTEQSKVTIRIENEVGDVVHTFCEDRFLGPGNLAETFQVESARLPHPVAKCNYVISVQAVPTYSSKKYHFVNRRAPLRPF
jgi:DNA-binding beta-propeller fold protein YncE